MFDKIESGIYWDRAWSLVSGCTRCSQGCDHCWALAMEKRFKKLTTKEWPKSEIEVSPIQTHPERLQIPLRRKKPTVYAIWNDLFHESVSDRFIGEAWDVMTRRIDHVFLVLTKRPGRMLNLAKSWKILPFRNIWPGVTVCNQDEADEKIPLLLQVPAAVRWVSIEPMLGPIIFNRDWFCDIGHTHQWGSKPLVEGISRCKNCNILLTGRLPAYAKKSSLDWVVWGGETGHGARPMHPDWARSVRDQCQAAGVPFLFKQWGEWIPAGHLGREIEQEALYAHDWRDGTFSVRIGKKKAGRTLDGKTWLQIPGRER